MAETNDDDPFEWEVDRVVQELCTLDRSWKPAPRAQLPDPTQLEAKLRDGDYNGEVLLIALDDETDLWFDMGITATKFKQSIRTAIRQFRNRSRKFTEYQNSLQNNSMTDMDVEKLSSLAPGLPQTITQPSDGDNNGQAHLHTSGPMVDVTQSHHQDGDATEPPRKKPRRLGGSDFVSVERPTQTAILKAIPTEADVISVPSTEEQTGLLDMAHEELSKSCDSHKELVSKPHAFWGNGRLSVNDFLHLNFESAMDDSPEFSWARPKPFGRGRKKYANSKMKWYLRNAIASSHDSDEVLPLYGDSDEEDYTDAECESLNREIEQDEEEMRIENEKRKISELQPEMVDACLKQMIDEHTTHWQVSKLPKLQRKAHAIWTRARKKGNRNSRIVELSRSLEAAEVRFHNVTQSLKENVYKNETELRRMREVLEPPIYETEEIRWEIGTLKSTVAPEKISFPHVPANVPKKPKVDHMDDGMDLWDEEETDGVDDFIVDDEPLNEDHENPQRESGEGTAHQAMELDSPVAPVMATFDPGQSFASVSNDIAIHDLTQAGSAKDPFNLCTPTKLIPQRELFSTDCPWDRTDGLIPVSEVQKIADKGTEYWQNQSDTKRLVITIIHHWSQHRQTKFFEPILYSENSDQIWQEDIKPAIIYPPAPPLSPTEDSKEKTRRDTAIRLARLFDIFTGSPLSAFEKFKKLGRATTKRIGQKKNHFNRFWLFLRSIEPYFRENSDPLSPNASVDKEVTPIMTPSQKKKRSYNTAAQIRHYDTQGTRAQKVRSAMLRRELEDSAKVTKEMRRLIINESKLDGQGLIYVHEHIAPRIKDHQIDGVRFMWDQVTRGTGCLLAHTMGLGKTMQVITLLTTIADAAKNEDITISSQIPEHLKQLKTLILCPPGILNNWIDELLLWAPEGMLGQLRYVDSSTPKFARAHTIKQWAADGGVLVIGYSLLSSMKGKHDELLELLLKTPSLVVGDEAHYLKNTSSKRGEIAHSFKTKTRIALTGSPLANNVDEYYSMIHWISPGFLGKPEDFSSRYAGPIKDGLWKSSLPQDRRKAKICLAALKKLVAPKVHRMTVTVLKDSLPRKKEFVLYLDLIDVQKRAYQAYVQGILGTNEDITVQTVWGLTATLRELLAHPSILQKKLQAKQEGDGKATAKRSRQTNQDEELSEPAEVLNNTLELLNPHQSFDVIGASYKMLVLDKILEESIKLKENVLIFSQSLLTLDYIELHLCRRKQRAYKRLDGSTPTSSRQEIVKSFNSRESQAFLISTTAGGVGLNIYGANRMVILDFKYNPVHEQQAIGRAYRIGQTKEVFVYWLICDGTFEKILHQHQVFKTQLASRVVDAKHPLPKADRELLKWFQDYQEAPHQDISEYRGNDPIMDALLDSEIIRNGISSIDTTETFEEEEVDKVLNAADQEVADRMADEQALRKTDASGPQQTDVSGLQKTDASGPQQTDVPGLQKTDAPVTVHSMHPQQHTFNQTSYADNPAPAPIPTWSSPMPDSRQGIGMHQPSRNVLPPYQQQDVGMVRTDSTTPRAIGNQGGLPSRLQFRTLEHPTSETNPQHQQRSSAWPMGLDQHQDDVVPLGVNSTASEQSLPITPAHDSPEPIMMNAQQRSSGKRQTLTEQAKRARENFRKKLLEVHTIASDRPKIEKVVQEIDQALSGGLQKQKMWDDLSVIVSDNPTCAAAIINGRIQPQALAGAGTSKDKLKELLLGKSRERDPDHASQFLQRASRESGPINEQKAKDLAAMREFLRHRPAIIKREGQKLPSSRPASISPNISGTSVADPFVIDD